MGKLDIKEGWNTPLLVLKLTMCQAKTRTYSKMKIETHQMLLLKQLRIYMTLHALALSLDRFLTISWFTKIFN